MTDLLKLYLEASVMACAMTGVVLLVRAVLAKRMHPAIMLFLWGIVLVRLCLPFTLASPVNLITIPQQSISSVNTDNIPSNTVMAASSPAYVTDATQTVPQNAAANTSEMAIKPDTDALPSDITNSPVYVPASPWVIPAYVWAAGAAATLLVFAVKAGRFNKRVKLCAHVTDKRVLEIIARHKEETGVKKAITVLQCDFAHSPMVFGYFRPRVLIPSRFFDMNAESLRSILLHEVCHIRRRDILVNYVWLAAKALHWFNPLVWLAYEWYEDDMELCRDYNVARALKADGAFVYSMSLIEAARLSRQAAPVPSQAAALFEKRCSLSARILRLMKPAKETRYSVVLSAVIALVMTVACFTTACQPIPAADKNGNIVHTLSEAEKAELQKNRQALDEEIKALGSHLEMQIKPNDQVTINVDADITPPGNASMSAVRVRPKNASKEQLDTLIGSVTNGEPVYYESNGYYLTKEELTAFMPKLKAYLENKDLPEYVRNAWEERLGDMEQAYKWAKSIDKLKRYDGTLVSAGDNDMYSTITQLKCFLGKATGAQLSLWQSPDGTQSQVTFDGNEYGSFINTVEPYAGVDAERIDMTYEQAKAEAEQFVHAMDGEQTNLAVYESGIGYQIGALPNYTKETSPQWYVFRFARTYNGIPVKRLDYLFGAGGDIDYSRQILPESVYIEIDSDGINSFAWLDQTEYIETEAEDTKLLDFGTVKSNFEKYCREQFTWAPGDDSVPMGLSVSLNIKRVELSLLAIPENEDLKSYITVPVWDFIGDMEYEEGATAEDGYPLKGLKDISIVAINAIDGTIINREQGY